MFSINKHRPQLFKGKRGETFEKNKATKSIGRTFGGGGGEQEEEEEGEF